MILADWVWEYLIARLHRNHHYDGCGAYILRSRQSYQYSKNIIVYLYFVNSLRAKQQPSDRCSCSQLASLLCSSLTVIHIGARAARITANWVSPFRVLKWCNFELDFQQPPVLSISHTTMPLSPWIVLVIRRWGFCTSHLWFPHWEGPHLVMCVSSPQIALSLSPLSSLRQDANIIYHWCLSQTT